MRLAALRQQFRSLLGGKLQPGAIVNRRRAARDLYPALALQLLRRLETGIEPARRLQRSGRSVIKSESLRLAHFQIRLDAEPGQIDFDRRREFLRRAFEIGVVETQNEGAAMPAGEEIVQKRRAGVADMDAARRRRGEANHGRDKAFCDGNLDGGSFKKLTHDLACL